MQRIQNKAIRIINFAKFEDPSTPLYQKSEILKISEHVKLQNFLFVHQALKGDLPLPLNNSFQIAAETHSANTRWVMHHKLLLPKARTQNYGINSIKYRSAAFWNYMVSLLPDEKFQLQSRYVCKKSITKYLIGTYQNIQ